MYLLMWENNIILLNREETPAQSSLVLNLMCKSIYMYVNL